MNSRIYQELMNNTKQIVLNIGGGCSGKSYSTAKYVVDKKLEYPFINIAIVRKSMIQHTYSTKQSIKEFLSKELTLKDFNFFSTKNINYRIGEEKYNIIWIEEASDLTEKEFKHILSFLQDYGTIILTCNPVESFVKYLLNREDVLVIKSTYKDNPYCPPEVAKNFEELKTMNSNFYKIYALGEFANE